MQFILHAKFSEETVRRGEDRKRLGKDAFDWISMHCVVVVIIRNVVHQAIKLGENVEPMEIDHQSESTNKSVSSGI